MSCGARKKSRAKKKRIKSTRIRCSAFHNLLTRLFLNNLHSSRHDIEQLDLPSFQTRVIGLANNPRLWDETQNEPTRKSRAATRDVARTKMRPVRLEWFDGHGKNNESVFCFAFRHRLLRLLLLLLLFVLSTESGDLFRDVSGVECRRATPKDGAVTRSSFVFPLSLFQMFFFRFKLCFGFVVVSGLALCVAG